ncbi:hypothetical protein QTP70_017795 [Hemibagrus guttatus]|uniref:Uncharacterized protein n=1 Tax=Hemibagrus guttatus TaxID=175788 RepID=A0AAE0PQV7_9TELE|nr:hypothetical protein QTP70_017795 [Hemibagrus guttatus]
MLHLMSLVHYYIHLRGDGERREERADTHLSRDPEQTLSTDADSALVESDLMSDVDGVRVTQTDSAVPEDSLSEAEEKNQTDEVSGAPVDSESSNLEDRVRELEELLCEAHRECERKNKDRERAEEAYRILQSQYEETLKQWDELLMVCLPEAERKYEQAMETNAQLEKEKSNLMSRVDTMQGSMQQLGHILCETRTECVEAKRKYEVERKLHKYVQAELNKKKENRRENLRSLRESVAEATEKYEEAMVFIDQLEDENSKLKSDVETLQDSVQELDRELSVSRITCKETTRECDGAKQELRILQSECSEMKEILLKEREQELEAHNIRASQYDQMTLTHNEKLLKISLAEAEARYEQEKETNTHLEKEKSDLMSQVEKLKGTVEGLGELLSEKHSQCAEALLECSKTKSIQATIKSKEKTLEQEKESLKVSLLEAETKYSEVMKTNTKLEYQNSTLLFDLVGLQDLMRDMKRELSETKRTCNTALRECEQGRETSSILQSQCDQMKETLSDKEKSHMVALAEAVEKYNQAMESNAQLENEKSDLMDQVHKLQSRVQQLEEELSGTCRKCEEITENYHIGGVYSLINNRLSPGSVFNTWVRKVM